MVKTEEQNLNNAILSTSHQSNLDATHLFAVSEPEGEIRAEGAEMSGMNKPMSDSTPIVTVGQVSQKRAERAEKVKAREALDAEIAALDRWLDAAAILAGTATPRLSEPAQRRPAVFVDVLDLSDVTVVPDENMADATKRILGEAHKSLSNQELIFELSKVPLFKERLEKNPNYFYTLVSRLIRRGEITRFRKRLSVPKQETAAG